jgi:hypothetical protein
MDILIGIVIGFVFAIIVAMIYFVFFTDSIEAPPQETVCACCATCDDDDWVEELAANGLDVQRELTRFWRNRALAVERGSMPVDDETRWRVSELERKVREQEGEL